MEKAGVSLTKEGIKKEVTNADGSINQEKLF